MGYLNLLTLLCTAIKNRDLERTKNAIAAGADPNGYRHQIIDRPPMNEAAANDFVPGLKVLCAAGGRIDGVLHFMFSHTPLMTAASYGGVEAAHWLLSNGADALIRTKDRGAPLEIALRQGHLAMAKVIMTQRPELNGNALAAAAGESIKSLRDAETIRWLLHKGVSPNITGSNGQSWLMLVQTSDDAYGHLVETLLAAGAVVNFQDVHGRTALHRTASLKSVPGFMRLLRAGANPDLADDNGHTVRAVVERHIDGVMKEALAVWEASSAAHRIINTAPEAAGLRPL